MGIVSRLKTCTRSLKICKKLGQQNFRSEYRFKYLFSNTTSGCKNIGNKEFEFLTRTQFRFKQINSNSIQQLGQQTPCKQNSAQGYQSEFRWKPIIFILSNSIPFIKKTGKKRRTIRILKRSLENKKMKINKGVGCLSLKVKICVKKILKISE